VVLHFFPRYDSGGTVEFGLAATISESFSFSDIVDGSAAEDFTISSSCDDDNGLVLQDVFGDIEEPVVTFTGYLEP
jgi:hypothetical protein